MATILVVEDEGPNVEILSRLLKRNGYQVVVAQCRDVAIAAMSEQPIDLVLMDIGIPDHEGDEPNFMAGLEATRWIKANAATKAVPIIATSASAMPDDKRRFLEAGCDDVQSKPFDFATLLEAIRQQLLSSRGHSVRQASTKVMQ